MSGPTRRSFLTRGGALACWIAWLALGSRDAAAQAAASASPAPAPLVAGGVLARQFVGQQVLYHGPTSGISARTVALDGKRQTTLGVLARDLFASQRRLEQELAGASAGALWGPVRVEERAFELPDCYVLTRTVSFTVADPTLLAAASSTFRATVLAPSRTMTVKDLGPAARARFFQDKARVSAGPADHPLRLAAARGDQALLDAAGAGLGETRVSDGFLIPKVSATLVSGRVMTPTVQDGRYNFAARSALQRSIEAQVGTAAPDPAPVTKDGQTTVTRAFVNGWGLADNWHWERNWDFWTGHLYLSAGLHYGVGLRFPIRMSARMQPEKVITRGSTDSPVEVFTDVAAWTLDADAAFYAESGMAPDHLFDGHEFVLVAGLGYGYSLEVLWTSIAERPFENLVEFDFSRDFQPPFGGAWQPVGTYFVPPGVTHTEINLGAFSGSLAIGARLDGRGRIDLEYGSLYGGVHNRIPSRIFDGRAWQSAETHRLQLPGPGYPHGVRTTLPTMPAPGSVGFGFSVGDLRYRSDWSVVPGLRFGLGVDFLGFHRAWHEDLWFDSLRISLGSLEVDAYGGTRTEYRGLPGSKTYSR